MLRIAVTGGIACGKSRVGSILVEAGVVVCDADSLAHEALRPGTATHDDVVDVFGEGILAHDGLVDRRRLGRIVFSDAEKLAALCGIVHPWVKKEWTRWLRSRETDSSVAAVIIPLLFEVNEAAGWDATICVGASAGVQVKRMRERGLNSDDISHRLEAQLDVREKMELADYAIQNDGSENLLKEQSVRILEHISGRRSWR